MPVDIELIKSESRQRNNTIFDFAVYLKSLSEIGRGDMGCIGCIIIARTDKFFRKHNSTPLR